MSNDKALFGLPIIETDAVPQGELLLGRIPTFEEVLMYGSYEAAIEAQKNQWAKIKNISTDNT